MPLDLNLTADLVAALRSADGRAAIAEVVREALRVELPAAAPAALKMALDARDADAVGGLSALAVWLGRPSAEAARKRVERDPDLAALAFRVGTQRRWRRSEVQALLQTRRSGE